MDDSLAVFQQADIALERDGVDAVLTGDLVGDLLSSVSAGIVIDRDVGAFCGELLTDQSAEASLQSISGSISATICSWMYSTRL